MVDLDIERPSSSGAPWYISVKGDLGQAPENIAEYLHSWSIRAPKRVFLAEKTQPKSWRKISYINSLKRVCEISSILLGIGCEKGQVIACFSRNTVDFGLFQLAAMQVGVIVAPLSEKLLEQGAVLNSRLNAMLNLLAPTSVYCGTEELANRFIALANVAHVEPMILVPRSRNKKSRILSINEYEGPVATANDVSTERQNIVGDDIAKILFTSGSAGSPKGVINTHRMLCAQQEMMSQAWPFLEEEPPVLVDWLPWTHTSGGNNSFNMVLRNGGSLFIDDGKPNSIDIKNTVANLTDVSPTWYTNVPLAYNLLCPHLNTNKKFRESFFRRLRMLIYGGASLDIETWKQLQRHIEQLSGKKPAIGSGWGSTETCSTATVTRSSVDRAGQIGFPLPGVQLKLTPNYFGFDVRAKGANITPGYYLDPLATENSFDQEGFLRIGDTLDFVNKNDPHEGLVFVNRSTDNFKLASGSWIDILAIRNNLLGFIGEMIHDMLIVGPSQEYLGAIFWLISDTDEQSADCSTNKLVEGIRNYNDTISINQLKIVRFIVSTTPLSLSQGEITLKGNISNAVCRQTRENEIALLFEIEPQPTVFAVQN